MNSVSEARLAEVCSQLAGKVRTLDTMFQQANPNDYLIIEQGLRSWAKQAELFAQGRTSPGPIVTKAAPGHGWHEFGMAVDVCPNSLVSNKNWSPDSVSWKRIETMAVSLGLFPGAEFRSFPDQPHLQLTGRFPVSPTDEVRQFYMDGGIPLVWQEAFKV